MEAFNAGFPVTYPRLQYQVPQQSMTPPIIRADIVQVDSAAAIDRYPMNAGTTQMFITKDDEHIVIRSMFANGQHSDDIYDRRPPAPPAPVFDPGEYVRKDEVTAMIEAALVAQAKSRKEGKA